MLIGGDWRDARLRRAARRARPRHRRGDRPRCPRPTRRTSIWRCGRRAPHSSRASGARRGPSIASAGCSSWPICSKPTRPSSPRSKRSTTASRSSSRSASTCRRRWTSCATAPVGRRRSKARTVDAVDARLPQERVLRLHATRAGRRGRRDHPVELSAADGGVEDRPGARHRLQHRAETGRGDAAHRAASGRAARSRPDSRRARSTSSPATARAPGAALAAHPGIDKVAFTGSTAVGKRIGQAALDNMTRHLARARRQVAGDRARRRRSEDGRERGRQRDLLQLRSGLRGRVAALRAAQGLRRGARRRERDRRQDADRPGPRDRARSSGRWSRSSSCIASPATCSTGLDEGATLVAGGARHGDARLVPPADHPHRR